MAAIRRFTDLRKADVNFAGGKGANLGELTRAGLPVPPGFVIGAPAYMAFCDAGGLRGRIAAYLEHVVVDDTAALAQTAAEVRDMIMAEPLPEWLEHDIRDAYEELRAGDPMLAVAVRSSATAEDTESASFAPHGRDPHLASRSIARRASPRHHHPLASDKETAPAHDPLPPDSSSRLRWAQISRSCRRPIAPTNGAINLIAPRGRTSHDQRIRVPRAAGPNAPTTCDTNDEPTAIRAAVRREFGSSA